MTGEVMILLSVLCICVLVNIAVNSYAIVKWRKSQEEIKNKEKCCETEKDRIVCCLQELGHGVHRLEEKQRSTENRLTCIESKRDKFVASTGAAGCKEVVRKKVKSWCKDQSQWGYICPNCGSGLRGGIFLAERDITCPKCGYELDWTDVDGS